MKRTFLWGAAVVVVVVVVAFVAFWWSWFSAQRNTASLVTLDPEDLKLTLAWSGEVIEVPPPATIPKSITESWAYRKRVWTGNVASFKGHDEQGNSVVFSALGLGKDAQGIRHPVIPSIKILSPSGVLVKDTTYSPSQGCPDVWTLYNPDGSKRLMVWCKTSGDPPVPCIKEVTYYDPDGTGRRYVAGNPERIVWAEWEVDSKGSIQRLINGGKRELVEQYLEEHRHPTAGSPAPAQRPDL